MDETNNAVLYKAYDDTAHNGSRPIRTSYVTVKPMKFP